MPLPAALAVLLAEALLPHAKRAPREVAWHALLCDDPAVKKQLAAHADALGEIYAALLTAESPRKARSLDDTFGAPRERFGVIRSEAQAAAAATAAASGARLPRGPIISP